MPAIHGIGAFELTLRDTPTWRVLSSWGTQPTVGAHSAVYDPAQDRMIAISRQRNLVLQWGQPARKLAIDVRPGSPVDGVSANSKGRVVVSILGSEDLPTDDLPLDSLWLPAATMAQDGNGTPWTRVRDVNRDGLDDLVFAIEAEGTDWAGSGGRVVVRGRSRNGDWAWGEGHLRVTPPSSRADTESLEPRPRRTSLRLISSNPCRPGDLKFEVTLAQGEPASLDCVDVTGRVVTAMPLDHAPTGTHEIRIDPDGRWHPGVYFARIRQGATSSVIRFAIIR